MSGNEAYEEWDVIILNLTVKTKLHNQILSLLSRTKSGLSKEWVIINHMDWR